MRVTGFKWLASESSSASDTGRAGSGLTFASSYATSRRWPLSVQAGSDAEEGPEDTGQWVESSYKPTGDVASLLLRSRYPGYAVGADNQLLKLVPIKVVW